MKYGLAESVIKKMNAVFVRYPQVELAMIYGSRARGSYKRGSDIDLTLVGGPKLTHGVMCLIDDELDDLTLPQTIDLSIFGAIRDSGLVAHIRREGEVFYERVDYARKTSNPLQS